MVVRRDWPRPSCADFANDDDHGARDRWRGAEYSEHAARSAARPSSGRLSRGRPLHSDRAATRARSAILQRESTRARRERSVLAPRNREVISRALFEAEARRVRKDEVAPPHDHECAEPDRAESGERSHQWVTRHLLQLFLGSTAKSPGDRVCAGRRGVRTRAGRAASGRAASPWRPSRATRGTPCVRAAPRSRAGRARPPRGDARRPCR